MNNVDLFSTPISSTKVRKGVYAHRYRNGCINIQGEKYFDYTVKEAIKLWRNKNKK
jgi:hypothetical protein